MRSMSIPLVVALLIAYTHPAEAKVYSSPRTGKVEVTGAFLTKYRQLGAQRGPLGFPLGEARPAPDGGRQMVFEHGVIRVSPSGAAEALTLPGATFTASAVTFPGSDVTVTRSADGLLLQLKGPAGSRDEVRVDCICISRHRPRRPPLCNRPQSENTSSNGITVRCEAAATCNGLCLLTYSW